MRYPFEELPQATTADTLEALLPYYDIQFEDLIGETEDHERTGMFTMEHDPTVLKNQVFLPIPAAFERHMVSTERVLKFTVRHQILGVGGSDYCWD